MRWLGEESSSAPWRAAPPAAAADECFRPIFVVGCPRSGTTLLSVILDRHSQLSVPPETHFAATVVPAAFAQPAARRQSYVARDRVVEDVMRHTPLRDLNLDSRAVARRLRDQPMTPAALLRAVLEEYAATQNKTNVAEKTPGHELHLEQFLAWFPHARFIWIVRDGRDVVLSQQRMHWVHEPLWQLSLHWVRSAIHVLRFAAAHPHVLCRVHYEALVREPERELARLHDFLGLDFEPQQLWPNMSSAVIPTHENGWKGRAQQAIDGSRSQAWRRNVSGRRLLLLNCLMGRHLRMLGYADTSVREFGPHAVALSILADIGLRIIFARQVYPVARALYRAGRRGMCVSRRLLAPLGRAVPLLFAPLPMAI